MTDQAAKHPDTPHAVRERMHTLELAISTLATRDDLENMRAEVHRDLANFREEMSGFRREMRDFRQEMRDDMKEFRAEIRERLDQFEKRMEKMQQNIERLAQNQAGLAQNQAKVEGALTSIRWMFMAMLAIFGVVTSLLVAVVVPGLF